MDPLPDPFCDPLGNDRIYSWACSARSIRGKRMTPSRHQSFEPTHHDCGEVVLSFFPCSGKTFLQDWVALRFERRALVRQLIERNR
jgi:hypothetical protein